MSTRRQTLKASAVGMGALAGCVDRFLGGPNDESSESSDNEGVEKSISTFEESVGRINEFGETLDSDGTFTPHDIESFEAEVAALRSVVASLDENPNVEVDYTIDNDEMRFVVRENPVFLIPVGVGAKVLLKAGVLASATTLTAGQAVHLMQVATVRLRSPADLVSVFTRDLLLRVVNNHVHLMDEMHHVHSSAELASDVTDKVKDRLDENPDLKDRLDDDVYEFLYGVEKPDFANERWSPWVPDPQALPVSHPGVEYWDFTEIRDVIAAETGTPVDSIEYATHSGAGSPYAFVDMELEREFVQVTAMEDRAILYEVITGTFSENDARTKLEAASIGYDVYNGYRLYRSEEYAVGVTDGAIILPNSRRSIGEQVSLIKTAIDTEQGDTDRYYDVDADFEGISDLVITNTPGLQFARITTFESGTVEDLVANGESWVITDEEFKRRYYVLFDDESNVDVDLIRQTVDDDPEMETEFWSRDRGVIATLTWPVPDDEPFRFSLHPSRVRFFECDLIREYAQHRYGCHG